MSDQEVELGDGDPGQSYDEGYEDPGPSSEVPSPSHIDNGLDSITGADPQTQRAEEGSNTLHPSEQPDVISSYTGQEAEAQANGYDGADYGEQAGEPGEGQPQDLEQLDEYAAAPEDADTQAEADPPPDPEPGPAAAEGSSLSPDPESPGPGPQYESEPAADPGDEPAFPGPDEDQQPDGYTADATAGDPGDETAGDADGYDVGADDGGEAAADAQGYEPERPASAAGEEQPAASTSRPASATARPPSARPGSARPGSSSSGVRRASAGGAGGGSRPASAAMLNLTPDSVGLVGPGQGAVSVGAGGSRPQSSGSRPGSSGGGPLGQQQYLQQQQQVMMMMSAPGGMLPQQLNQAQIMSMSGLPTVTIPEDQPLAPAKIERYIAPGLKAIEVEVEQGPGMPHRLVRVLMDLTQCDAKPYLGGFRNKRTGAVYHHAGTQTPRAPKYSEADRKLSRETQTVKIKQHSQQTVREQATQMERPGLDMDTTYDRVITPGRYQTADERDAIVLAATRCIQRWVRGWLGRRRAAYLRRKKAEREAFLREQELAAQMEAEEHRRREIQRRMHPRTAADFEVLYNELEAWRLQETRKIKEAGLPKEQEQQVLQQLLHKETKLLQTIDRLKINANQENKEARIQHTLNEMSKPKKFSLRNGGKVDVHTPFTTRAKELQQLYNGLNLPLLTVDERLDVLLHVKWTVKEFDCDLTREIVGLIDREADLLNRGRNPKMLEGLRKRIAALFLNFIETPEFNPEAARFQIVPMDFETYLYEKVDRAMAKAGTTLSAKTTMAF